MFSHVRTTRTHTQVAHRDIRKFCQKYGLAGPQVFEDAHGNLRLYRAPLAGGGPDAKEEEEVAAGDQAGPPCTEAFIARCCNDVLTNDVLTQGEGIGLIKETMDLEDGTQVHIWGVDPNQFKFIQELTREKRSFQQKQQQQQGPEDRENRINNAMNLNDIATGEQDNQPATGSINYLFYMNLLTALVLKHNTSIENQAATTSDTTKSTSKSKSNLTTAGAEGGNDTPEINCDPHLIQQCCTTTFNYDNTNFNLQKLFTKITDLKKLHEDPKGKKGKGV